MQVVYFDGGRVYAHRGFPFCLLITATVKSELCVYISCAPVDKSEHTRVLVRPETSLHLLPQKTASKLSFEFFFFFLLI